MTMGKHESQWLTAIRNAKTWGSAAAAFEALAYITGVPDDWKEQGGGYTLENAVQQIEDYYQIDLFRRPQQ